MARILIFVAALLINNWALAQIDVRNDCKGVPESRDVLMPNPLNCSTYIQCVHQKPLVRNCPQGLEWNTPDRKCDWPELAKCNKLSNCDNVPETKDVLLPNPEDCSTYIQCVHQKPVVRPCPAGLNWNEKKKSCDWPQNSECNAVPPKSTNTSTSESNTYAPAAQIPVKNCNGVPEHLNVLLANPANCSSFIQCVHQKPVIIKCPPGLHWSVSTNRCDWPANARCKIRNSCEGVRENEDVLLPNEGDCTTYIQCEHQKPVVRECPAGLHFNARSKTCDWPENSGCNVVPSKSTNT